MRREKVILSLGFLIIVISGLLIVLNVFEINNKQVIMDNQKEIIDENRQWVEKITFWEVTGGLGEDIIEGEKDYYDALTKYSAALQAQTISIFFIILLSIIIVITVGIIVVKIL